MVGFDLPLPAFGRCIKHASRNATSPRRDISLFPRASLHHAGHFRSSEFPEREVSPGASGHDAIIGHDMISRLAVTTVIFVSNVPMPFHATIITPASPYDVGRAITRSLHDAPRMPHAGCFCFLRRLLFQLNTVSYFGFMLARACYIHAHCTSIHYLIPLYFQCISD